MADSKVTTTLTDSKQIESKVAALDITSPFSFTACFFSFNQNKTYFPFCHLTLTGDIDATCCDFLDKTSLNALWPDSMLQAPRIVIDVFLSDSKIPAWRHPSDFFAVYHFFASLTGFLGGSSLREQRVKIKFMTSGPSVKNLLHPNVLAALDGFLVEPEVEPAEVWTPRRSTPDSSKG